MLAAVVIAFSLVLGLAAGQAPAPAPDPAALDAVAAPAPPELPSWGPILRNQSCGFVYTSPRFYRVEAEVTLQGVTTNDTLLNDAFIRLLRSRLGLTQCQLGMSEGANCTSGTQQLPCSDPVFNCGAGIVISEDVYNAVASGDCAEPAANGTLVCGAAAANPAIAAAVAAGSCRPACLSGTPQAGQDFPVACASFLVGVDAPDRGSALAAAAALGNATLQADVSAGLANYTNGPGMQFLVVNSAVKTAVGYGFFPPPPPPLVPIRPPAGAPTNATAAALAASGSLVYGPWSACVPSCGAGLSTRTATCYAPDGTLLPLAACPGGAEAQTSQPCTTDCSADAPRFEYSAWSACNATCGGGVAARIASCVSPDGSPSPSCPAAPEPTEMTCNTAPCASFSWWVSAWGACSAPCGGGNRTRVVMCVDGAGVQASHAACPGRKPRANEACNVQPCDFCADNPCLGRGTCAGGACACRDGYAGPFCEVPASCASGVVDSLLACCPSGLVNLRGECCPEGSRLDADGECCGQQTDVCGVCGGTGVFVDMQGTCCSVADANGLCCPSGLVDECGVCDGAGTSCAVTLAAQLEVPPELVQGGAVLDAPLTEFFRGAAAQMGLPPDSVAVTNLSTGPPVARRRLLQDAAAAPLPAPPTPEPAPAASAPAPAPLVAAEGGGGAVTPQPTEPLSLWATVTVAPSPNATGTTPFSSSYIAAQLPAAAAASPNATASGIALEAAPRPGRAGLCGNGVCEIGERSTVGAIEGSCPADCGLPAVACLGGCGAGGNCMPSTGVCLCYVGYQGPNCGECAPGFQKLGGVCVASVTALRLVNATVLSPEGEALVSGEPDDGGADAALIAGIVLGSLAGLALLVAAFFLLRRCLARRYAGEGEGKAAGGPGALPYGAVYGTQPGAAAGVDEEIGLRQLYGVGGGGALGGGGAAASARSFDVHVDVSSARGGASGGPTFVAYGGGGGGSAAPSARSGDGWVSARESARSGHGYAVDPAAFQHIHSQSLHYAPQGPAPAMERLSTFSRPAPAEAAGPPLSRPASARGDVFYDLPAAPPLPAPEETRFGAHREAQSYSSRSLSHSAAVSLALEGLSGGAGASSSSGGSADQPRLFFNPAFSAEGRPGDLAAAAGAAGPGRAKPLSARGPGSLPSSARGEGVAERRAKLDALRAAVRALEHQAAAGRGGAPLPGSLPGSARGAGDPAQLKDAQGKAFLPGRPVVPRLSLAGVGGGATAAAAPLARQDSGTLSQGSLIKAHPGPSGAAALPPPPPAEKRPSPGAALARGAKTMLRTLGGGGKADGPARPGPAAPAPAPGDFNDVMAKVEGALRSAGNSPVKAPTSGRGSARGGSARPSRGPAGPAPVWR